MDTRSIKRNYQLQQWRKIIQEQTTSGLTIDELARTIEVIRYVK